jgi:hypothetical protein
MLKLHLASTILALKHSWLVLQHKERRHWTNNFMVYSSNLLLNRCFPCFMVYVLHTWYCFCLKNSLLFLLIKKIKFGDSWVITFLILSGCYFNVFSFLVEMSLINRLFSCFQTQAEGYLVKFTWKRWSWKDWMDNGDNSKAITQRRTMLGIVLLEAPLIRYIVCRIMMVLRGFLTILQAELKASKGLCYLGRHLCFIF